jgi:acetyl esterase/lipase
MALLKRRYGGHLSKEAQGALSDQRAYPSFAAIRNPLTRPIARRVAESEWRATFDQIDFHYEMQDVVHGGVKCLSLRAGQLAENAPTIIYAHAGGFACGSPQANATAILPTCLYAGCETIAVEYTLAPEAVFPTQLIEIEAVYVALIAAGRNPRNIVIAGDSAGGALVVSSAYRWRRLSLPMPGGLVLMSPFLDAHAESDTYQALKGRDPLFIGNGPESCAQSFELYAGGADIRDPEISPLAGDPAGLPPTLIHVGTREVLLGDSARFAEKARLVGVDVSLRVFDGMFHLFHQHWRLAEAKTAHRDIADFVRRVAG